MSKLTRLAYLEELHRNFASRRTDFYRGNSLYSDVQTAIAKKEPLSPDTLKQYFAIGNTRIVELISNFNVLYNQLQDPTTGEYDKGIKGCADSREIMRTVISYLRRRVLHENSAGATVRKGDVFRRLSPTGVGFVVAHTGCGAEAFAHQYHTGCFRGTPDPHLAKIPEAIPYPVAQVSNSIKRTRRNARYQAFMARELLADIGDGHPVYPLVYDLSGWEHSQSANLIWVGDGPQHPLVSEMNSAVSLLWGMARELGRDPFEQFAHTAFILDASRMGRFPDPHALFDLLPNEAFSVTASFEDIEAGHLSSTAIAALKYAAVHDGGHIAGVGKANGNRHIMIIDPDRSILDKVEEILVSDPLIRDATRNGETIIRAQYDLFTHRVTFID